MAKSIIMEGFMGTGKTETSRRLAALLGVPAYDTDEWMKNEMGIDVSGLVVADRPEFRSNEAKALGQILSEEPGVVATGGGIVETAVGREALMAARDKDHPVLWLDAAFKVCKERVLQDPNNNRPLFDEAARERYDERIPYYIETSSVRVDANKDTDEVVNALARIARGFGWCVQL